MDMDMGIQLSKLFSGNFYFKIFNKEKLCNTSERIANILNLKVDTYNKLLIEKVIKHSNYIIDEYTKDIAFNANNKPKEIYIERFKDTFAKELVLLAFS